MALPGTNISDPNLTLSRDVLPSAGRSRTKVKCPGLLSSSGNNNNNNGESRRRITTANCSKKCSITEGTQAPSHLTPPPTVIAATAPPTALVKDQDMKEIMMVEVSNSVNDVDRRSPIIRSSFLARVDPVLDFWMVDEELQGTFHVCSTPPSTNHSKIWHQQAIIFKVKTTSPYNFFVRPICGLMRPNVVATVEVKCEKRSSQSRLEVDEFLVEIAPVPGAIAGMTNDLYTTALPSNFPELMAIWERIDQETNKGGYEIVREFHRVSCRFHRTSQDLSESALSPRMMKQELAEQYTQGQAGKSDRGLGDNNNPSTSKNEEQAVVHPHSQQQHLYENCSFTQPSGLECYLAREASDTQGQGYYGKDTHPDPPHSDHVCGKVRKLQLLNFILVLLLIATLIYIYFSQFYSNGHTNDVNTGRSNTNSDSNNGSTKIKELLR